MNPKEIMDLLQAPFPSADIEWRVGSTNGDKTKGLALAYVTNRAIQNRLDEVFGPFGWQNQFREWKGNSQLCGISIFWNGEWVTKWDGADDSNQEATKGGLSDSMKRAAYQWGIGRFLYKLPQQWVEIEPRGKSFVIKRGHEPKLPDWALPESERGLKQKLVDEMNKSQSAKQESKVTKATLKAKFKLCGYDITRFDSWYDTKIQGMTEAQMDAGLTQVMMEKKKGA